MSINDVKGMKRIRLLMQQKAVEKEREMMKRVNEKLPKDKGERIVYTPLVLEITAFDSIRAAYLTAKEERLDYKKPFKELKDLVTKTSQSIKISVKDITIEKLYNMKYRLCDDAETSFNNVWNIIEKEIKKKHPEYSKKVLTFHCNIRMAHMLMRYALKTNKECQEEFHRITGLEMVVVDETDAQIIKQLNLIEGDEKIKESTMMTRSLNCIVRKMNLIKKEDEKDGGKTEGTV